MNKPQICNRKWLLSLLCPLVCIIMLFSDIWSRASFWVTMHTSQVLMSAKQLTVHWGLIHLQTVIKVTFVANVGFIHSIWPCGCVNDSDDICGPNGIYNVPGISDHLLGDYPLYFNWTVSESDSESEQEEEITYTKCELLISSCPPILKLQQIQNTYILFWKYPSHTDLYILYQIPISHEYNHES